MRERIKVMKGEKYGYYTVLEEVAVDRHLEGKHRDFLCVCVCGSVKKVRLNNLRNGHTSSCGCMKGVKKRKPVAVGTRYGRLTVLSDGVLRKKKRTVVCVCECGKRVEVNLTNLVTGRSTSCGCYLREVNRNKATHGMSGSRTFRIWNLMIQRCENKNNPAYARYGGRGIKVSPSWHTFTNFLHDMGEGPEGMTLDRVDNNKGYSKNNCRWATIFTQANNKNNNHRITHNGQQRTLAEWSRVVGIKQETIRRRIKSGWSVEKALTIPPFSAR